MKKNWTPLAILSSLAFSLSAVGQTTAAVSESKEPAATSESKENFFASVAGTYTFPENDDWDYAIGLEAKVGIYITKNIRLFGLLGYSNWEIKSEEAEQDLASLSLDGNSGVISAGGGMDFLIPVTDKSALTLTASIQYQFVDSNLDVKFTSPLENQEINVDLGDAAAVYVGADYFFAITADLDLFVGGGYLFNISKADVTVEGINLGDTAFDGATLRFGLQF